MPKRRLIMRGIASFLSDTWTRTDHDDMMMWTIPVSESQHYYRVMMHAGHAMVSNGIRVQYSGIANRGRSGEYFDQFPILPMSVWAKHCGINVEYWDRNSPPGVDPFDGTGTDEKTSVLKKRRRPKVAAEPTPVPVNRDSILQNIARLLVGKIKYALIEGSPDRLMVRARHDKMMFVVGQWGPQAGIQDELALHVMSKHEGRILVEEQDKKFAEDQATIRAFAWDATSSDISKFLAEAKVAKAHGHRDIPITAVDGQISFTGNAAYSRANLEWALRKGPTSISVTNRGVVGLTIAGLVGDYIVYLRGLNS